MGAEAEETVSFGSFRLFPARRLLERASQPVRLGDRAFNLLSILIANAPEVVSKSTLLAQAWPDVTVEEGNLRLQMNALRRLLGAGDDGKSCIATFHGRGYCFVAAISRTTTQALGYRAEPVVEPEQPAGPKTNLLRPIARLIGRAEDLAELRTLLAQHRLVTIVGTGGIGKTRLAVELGLAMLGEFPGGVRLIDLASVSDPAIVVAATASVVGASLQSAEKAVDAVVTAIGRERQLLVFDNCEHLVGATAALITVLLGRLPSLSIVVTSQELLHIPAERVYRPAPLALPPPDATEITSFAAVSLFIERIEALDHRFELTKGNASGIAEICRSLDGLPLALEMAAGRVPMLGIEGLRSGLADRLRMLTASHAATDMRHGTLRATVEWSHRLLDETERRIFRRIGIFTGSFSLAAVLAVAGDTDRWTIVDAFGRLIDKSLVMVESGEPPRYRLPETLRLFAVEHLNALDRDEVLDRFIAYYADHFTRARLIWESTPETDWIEAYRSDIGDLRLALDWVLADPERAETAIKLGGGAAALLFDMLGLGVEGRKYLTRIIALIDAQTPPELAAPALRNAAQLWTYHDPGTAQEFLGQAAALYKANGSRQDLASIYAVLGGYRAIYGDPVGAKAMLLEADQILAGSERLKSRALVAKNLGSACALLKDFDAARLHFTHARDLVRALKANVMEYGVVGNLAFSEFVAGNIDRAIELGRQSVDGLRTTQTPARLSLASSNLAFYLIARDRVDEARALAEETLAGWPDEDGRVAKQILLAWALIGAIEGRLEEAAQVFGFLQVSSMLPGQYAYTRLAQILERGLPAEQMAAGCARGSRWSLAEADSFTITHLVPRREPDRATPVASGA